MNPHREYPPRNQQQCASGPPSFPGRNPRRVVSAVAALAFLLLLPGYAVTQLAGQADLHVLAGVPFAMSLVAYFMYGKDKRQAENGGWRIRESSLHIVEFAGGWPGAFVAQRRFRHKTLKVSYQITFWLIVSLHQLAAVDSLLGWAISKRLVRSLTY